MNRYNDQPTGSPLPETRPHPRPPIAPDLATIKGGKGGVFYRAHSYHTKVPVEGIVRLLEHYTEPGDFVADPFCGSGQTGVAAILTGRHAVLSDLSPAAVHIAKGYTTQVDPRAFRLAGSQLLERLADTEQSLYGRGANRVEYTVWSDEYECPECSTKISFWDHAVDHAAGTLSKTLTCPRGHGPFKKADTPWVRSVPVQQNISLPGARSRTVRELLGDDREPDSGPLPDDWFPTTPWEPWREMWRAQHDRMGIATAADFYTSKNLAALAALWREIGSINDPNARDALRFAFTSIVNRASRRYQWHPSRPTNVLSSTMYIASLNYEFNVFSLLRRKLATLEKMYEATWSAPGTCAVRQSSATDLGWLADDSVDYVFTDPPFGSNIFYGDSSFLWESWLGEHTDVGAETVVNRRLDASHGRTDLAEYEKAMASAMCETARVLRPNGWLSLQFHNSDDAVWSSVQSAVESADLQMRAAVVMDKGQKSFKGLRHASRGERVANFDLVMHLEQTSRPSGATPQTPQGRSAVANELKRCIEGKPASQRTTPWLHSQVMRYLLENGADLRGWSFAAVEKLCSELFDRKGTAWTTRN